jgi:hypothetical protein
VAASRHMNPYPLPMLSGTGSLPPGEGKSGPGKSGPASV